MTKLKKENNQTIEFIQYLYFIFLVDFFRLPLLAKISPDMKRIFLIIVLSIGLKISAFAASINNITGVSSSYCSGSPISLTFDYTSLGATNNFKIQLSDFSGSFSSGTQYLGTVNTVTISGVAQSISGTFPNISGNNYKIRIIELNSLTNSLSTSIGINPLPTSTISGTTTVCQNSTSPSITFTGSNGTKPYTFTYQINGGTNQTVSTTGSNSSVTVNAPTTTAGSFVYTLVSVQDANCSQNQSGSATVTVNPIPSISVTSQTLCSGTSISAIVSNTTGGTNSYSWTTS